MYIDHEFTHNMIAGLSFTKEGRALVDRSCSLLVLPKGYG